MGDGQDSIWAGALEGEGIGPERGSQSLSRLQFS
jgi:hypothetical protein